MFSYAFSIFSGILLIISVTPHVASYNKYGRTCKDIGCLSDETCIMAEDPCTGYTDKCGRYPTCRKTSDASCTSTMCGNNEYCRSENGAPKCVRKSTGLGYESAGVSYVNGEQVNGNNANPYANANAPPAPAYPPANNGGYDGNNFRYPSYPSNTGSSANGYPSYPQSSNQPGYHRDLGYPPYPTQNRMPAPGQPSYSGNPQAPGYPPVNYPSGLPTYQNSYPNYPYQRGYGHNTHSVRFNNAASVGIINSIILVGLTGLFLLTMR